MAEVASVIVVEKTLEERIAALERKHYDVPTNLISTVVVDESMRRCRQDVERLGLYSANWKWVPEMYYDWPMEQRAAVLTAPSTQHLCKSLLLENKKAAVAGPDFEFHPRFVLVVLQYQAELSTDLLTKSIRRLRPVQERLDASSNFDWRVADPADNDRITGYQFNSVTPFGLQEDVPIYLSSAVAELGYFWMGGGQ
jgi:prolyl-tRNA editing enzyme YbaK/EbsC (Cys-tRNA(Pro) deacylase)